MLGARERGVPVAGRLEHGLAELASDIRAMFEAAVPELRGADDAWRRLEAGIQHDVEAAATGDRSAALDVARRLSQRGISPLAIVRAYRLGQRRFMHRLITDVLERAGPDADEARATLETVDRVAAYVDDAVEQMIAAYFKSRKEWIDPQAILLARVRSVIDDRELRLSEAQKRVGRYRLCQNHLGAELWIAGRDPGLDAGAALRRLADALAAALGARHPLLFLHFETRSACAWLPLSERDEIAVDALETAVGALDDVYVAVGEVGPGLAGFRRTHQQAISAEAVARANDPPLRRVTSFADVAPIATMATDVAAAREWISETLGELAVDDERHASFRETARIFLETGRSYAATAERLFVHRNTAQYRVRTAEAMRGRPFRDGRLDVELALMACRWFGPAVLAPPALTSARTSPGSA